MSENNPCLVDNNCTLTTGSSGTLYKTILIIVSGTILSVLTIVGNLLVLISFRINKQLRTVTNYFLLSLAIADFTIGCFSMPIFFTFFEQDRWPFNSFLCDVWLSVDYTMSNASVANLLLICFDRYFSITRPLTYRTNRTPKRVSFMIACAWAISCLIWTPVKN
jgi:nitrate reductase gamma subunit